ncbi:MAG TPA: SPOR domain-containing protein [Melioribacteraceae bacterium]|nr:SPOR domain-containing protein [Melioribacteraceae bacterium]
MIKRLLLITLFGFTLLFGQTKENLVQQSLTKEIKPINYEKLVAETPKVVNLFTAPKKEIVVEKKEEVKVEEKAAEIEIKKELFDPTPYAYNLKTEKKIKGNIYTDGLLYCYQVSAFKSKKVAEKEVNAIKNKKFNAYITEHKDKKATWYRVRIGDFDTLQEAENSLKSFNKVFKK